MRILSWLAVLALLALGVWYFFLRRSSGAFKFGNQHVIPEFAPPVPQPSATQTIASAVKSGNPFQIATTTVIKGTDLLTSHNYAGIKAIGQSAANLPPVRAVKAVGAAIASIF